MSAPTSSPHSGATQLQLSLREVRRLVSLALPIMVSLSAATLIGVVDTVMISPLGTDALAAASIAASIMMIFYAGLYGLVSVGSVLVARAFGAGDAEGAVSALLAALVVALAGGLLGAGLMFATLFALPLLGQPAEVLQGITAYWTAQSLLLVPFALLYAMKGLYDATDRPWLGVGFSFVAVFVNIPANWIFIHGIGSWDGLGLVGAALASILSETLSLILALAYWRLAPSMAAYRAPARVKRSEVLLQIREGTTLALGYAGEGGSVAVAGLMLGWFGAQALAAYQIVGSVTAVFYMLPLGMAAAVAIRVSQAIGAGAPERARPIGFAAFGVVTLWMAVVTVLLIVFGATVSRALSDNAEVIQLATTMFIIFATMQIFDGLQASALGALRGMLDNRWPVVVTLLLYWLLALPLGWLIADPLGFGPNGIWIGYSVAILLAAAALGWRFMKRTA
ncbi:MAG: MATE family efflux transporter [Pseudomonadota bacterium]